MKKLLAFVLIFTAMFLTVACGGNGGGGNSVNDIPEYTEEQLKDLTATVTFWHAMGQAKTEIIQTMIKGFNKKYPNITVEIQNQGGYGDLRDKITKSIRTGDQPTVAQVYPDHVTLYMSGNAVRELDSYKDHKTYGLSAAQLNDYIASYYAEGKIYDDKGTLYSIPFNKSTEVLYFNASWFEEHGLLEQYGLGTIEKINDVKTFVPAENAHLTWEDIEAIGQYYVSLDEYKNRPANEKIDYYAFSYDSEDNLFITLTQQWGGKYTQLTGENSGEFVFDNQQSRNAMQWYLNGHRAGYFVTASAWNADYTSDKFVSGNVVMTIGSSAGCSYNNPGDKFVLGVLPYPQREANIGKGVEGGELVIQQGTNVALFKCEDPNEELAGWLFIKYITTWDPELSFDEQPTAIWAVKSGYFPILNSLMNSVEYQEFLAGGDDGQTLEAIVAEVGYAQAENYFVSPSFPGTSKCRDEVELLVEAILYGGKTLDQAYAQALASLNK